MVQSWMRTRSETCKPSTVNREVDVLKALLKAAVPKYLDASPLKGMRKLTGPRPKRHLMTHEEEVAILAHLKPDDRAIMLVGLDALVRLTDILDLRRSDDHGTFLYVADPKSSGQSEPHRAPISTRLRAALDALEPDPDSIYLFPRRRRASTEDTRRACVRYALANACRKAGVPYGRNKDGITFHWATRRTAATRLIRAGVDIKTVQRLGPWKTATIVLDVYAEVSQERMQEVVELIGAFPTGSRSTEKDA